MTDETPHPFEIFWDPEEESYFMFCPEGCVLVGGKAATNDEIENGNLRLDFGETVPDKVYLHVSKKEAEEGEEDPSDEWEFSVDGSATKTGASYNVLVARFGESENDGNSYDVVCSAISLGDTPTPTPIPWDLKLDGGDLYVFSPIAYVITANGKRKSQLKIIIDGATEGEWFKIQSLYNPVCCVISASVSGSGVISYSVATREPSDAIVLSKQVIGTITMPTGTRPVTGFTQLHRGAPTINGLGIADAASIFLNDNGETEIKGFKSQANEADKLAELLSRGDSADEYAGSVLVRRHDEDGKHKLVYVPIGKGIGGSGSTTGYTGTINVPTGRMRCNEASKYYIQNEYQEWTFENGFLKTVGEAQWPTSGGLATTPLSGT